MKRRLKRALAWSMVVLPAAGIGASQLGWVGAGEPKLVLQLSWFALLVTGLDALLITDDG